MLDIGRTFDVVNRHERVADILLTTELIGLSHHELALASAIVLRAGDRHADTPALASVRDMDRGDLDRAAIILTLADEIEARCPRNRPIVVTCTIGRSVTLAVPTMPSWLAKDIDKRFAQTFGRPLIVQHHVRESAGASHLSGVACAGYCPFLRKYRTNDASVSSLTWCSIPSASDSATRAGTPSATRNLTTVSWRCRDSFARRLPSPVRKIER